MSNNKIAYGIWTYKNDFPETKLCIERVSPHVDCTIINYNPTKTLTVDDIDNENIKWIDDNIEKYNLHIILSEFNDNFPEQRNKYLEKAKELKMDWICVSDNDELYSEDLAKNLRTLIEKYDSEGYSNIAVPCRDQFECIDWLDKLDLLKECPGGYRITDYYKPMLIFKLFPDIKYEGIGIEKNVHETLTTKEKRVTINLPKEYFYVHKKSSLKIWRNAARNMFISGGGDNCGSKNKLWTELRHLCSQVGINNWNEFEEFVNTGIDTYFSNITGDSSSFDAVKNEFRLWFESALKSLPTKEGTETRETAKWYYALHKNEITDRVKDLINKVPKINEEIETENFVTQMYYKILGRHPDAEGKSIYVKELTTGNLKRKDFIDILRNSEECKKKEKSFNSLTDTTNIKTKDLIHDEIEYDNIEDYDEIKWNKVEEFVRKMYVKILRREPDDAGIRHYTKYIMDEILKPSDLPDILRSSDEYKQNVRYFSNSGSRKNINIVKSSVMKFQLKDNNISNQEHNTLSLCIMGYHDGLSLIKESINVMKDYVNEIVIQGDNFTDNDIKELKILDDNVHVYIEPWNDNFSDYKNKCCSHATMEWLLILDHDEIPTKEMAEKIKGIIKSSDKGNNYDMVSFDVIDIKTLKGTVLSEVRSKGGKPLLHWNIPNPYIGNPHIWLKGNYYPWKEIHSDVAYKHIKEQGTDLERSVRNVFMGGGGDNSKEKNPVWVELRKICDELNLKTWNEFNEYLKNNSERIIDKKLLKIIHNLDEMPWKDGELKDVLRYYRLLHPEFK